MSAVTSGPTSMNVAGLLDTSRKPRPSSLLVPKTASKGLMMPLVTEVTTAVNAVPMTTATARSMTLPRIRKSLNPLNMPLL